MISRRSWIQQLSAIGAGSLLVSPTEILSSLSEYRLPADDRSMIRLSSNENPYSPSPAMKKALAFIDPEICRYPNRKFHEMEDRIASYIGVPAECVVVTSGSREGLKAVGLIKSIGGGEISCCLPTYLALLNYAEQWGAQLRVTPLKENMDYNLPGIYEHLNEATTLAFICNPNNPTGRLLPAEELEQYVRLIAGQTTVFVDEVYFDYITVPAYPSMAKLVLEGADVIVARTLSKVYGLAGARIGYLIARPDTAQKIRKTIMSGTNIFGITLGMSALDDEEFKMESLAKNEQCKQLICGALDELGLRYLPSHTNFVFFQSMRPISELQQAFREEGIEIGRAFPPYLDWCRISTGTIEEVATFVQALHRIVRR